MRILIAHETVYDYGTPAKSVIQTLRMTPRSHDGQHVVRWRIDVDRDVRLSESEDAFGNITHAFFVAGPIDQLRFMVEGEVETQDRAGVVRGSIERFPPTLYLRETPLSRTDADIVAFAKDIAATEINDLGVCHALMGAIHRNMTLVTTAEAGLAAPQVFAARSGTATDLAHVFIACARVKGIPARFVSGHRHDPDGPSRHTASHAWAEVFIPGLDWVGFDAAHNICPTDAHIRMAMGLDHLGAAPFRGARHGGDGETLTTRIDIREQSLTRPGLRQSHSQTQGQ